MGIKNMMGDTENRTKIWRITRMPKHLDDYETISFIVV